MTRHVMAVGVLAAMAAVTVGAWDAVTPEEAIRVAVEERLGLPLGNVSVSDVMTRVEAEAGLVAQPEVTARLGKTSRFVLSARGVRRGIAVAVVTVPVLLGYGIVLGYYFAVIRRNSPSSPR